MALEDRHIAYLRLVAYDVVAVKRQNWHRDLLFVHVGGDPLDQFVARQMQTLGLTRIVPTEQGLLVKLTPRGMGILADEDEAWA